VASPLPFLPERGEPLRRHVRATRSEVERLLDALIGSATVVSGGWSAAVDVALAHPAATVVTRNGDRFGITGWRVGGPPVGATGVALDEARRAAAAAVSLADDRAAVSERRRVAAADARLICEEASGAETANAAQRATALDRLQRAEAGRAEAEDEARALERQVELVEARLIRDRSRRAQLVDDLPSLESEHARRAALTERRRYGEQRLAEIEEQLARQAADREAAVTRRAELDGRALVLDRLAARVTGRLAQIEGELVALHDRRRRRSAAVRAVSARLEDARHRRVAEEHALEETRERSRRAEVDETEQRLRLEQAVEHCRVTLDCEPEQAMAAPCPPLPEGTSVHARARELERELRLMGPINPLALEELQALEERHQFLTGQFDDVKASRRELAKVIRAVDEEIVNVFAAAYADVSENFGRLFEMLFPGGRGRLSLTEPENLLDTGIEIEARPSGKNVKKLSLLSGGERSLTALALLFAVFRSRPSPFYVMDEVEAALDDVNLHRFLDLIAEFRREAQLVVVSHQKRTMEAADCLYGVTMQSGGSSKVISERVAEHA
jgi:chromosome segregation protein